MKLYLAIPAMSMRQIDQLGNGSTGRYSWIASGSAEAFLALDRNKDRQITNGKVLFGNITEQPKKEDPNGFIALKSSIRRHTMRKISPLSLSVVFCALVFIFAALIFQVRRSTEAVKQSPTITFKNQTTSIQISDIKQTDERVKLTVTNIGALPLAALDFDIKGGKPNPDYINVDFTPSEKSNGQLDPGKSETIHLGVRPLPAPGEIIVTLKMAFFIDGSAEGDLELVNRQRDVFSAMDSVYQLANIEIGKISTFDPVALVDAKSKIENLTQPANLTSAQQMGFKIGKDRAADLIDRLFRDASELSIEKKEERLATLKNKFSKALPGVNRREK